IHPDRLLLAVGALDRRAEERAFDGLPGAVRHLDADADPLARLDHRLLGAGADLALAAPFAVTQPEHHLAPEALVQVLAPARRAPPAPGRVREERHGAARAVV